MYGLTPAQSKMLLEISDSRFQSLACLNVTGQRTRTADCLRRAGLVTLRQPTHWIHGNCAAYVLTDVGRDLAYDLRISG